MNRFIILIVLFGAHSQVNSQPSPDWSRRFETYQSNWQKLKLHLIFNQDKYYPGDTAWFKGYFLTEDLHPVGGKQLIEFTLMDSKGNSKLHFVFHITDGVGYNQFVIPDTLSAGNYLVAAYNNWMKNFDRALVFQKNIPIVKRNALIDDEKDSVKVVAEGKHLIKSISNRIAIHTSKPETGVEILDSFGKKIADVVTDKNGAASLSFIPADDIIARIVGDTSRFFLAVEEGCTLQLTPSIRKDDSVKLVVNSSNNSSLRSQEFSVFVIMRGKIYFLKKFKLGQTGFATLSFSQDKLPEGIANVLVVDQNGSLLASRDFYTPGQNIVYAKIQSSKSDLQFREKVMLTISLSDSEGHPVQGEFGMKVIASELFDPKPENLLSDELNIFSSIENDFVIDRSNNDWFTSLDNFLITETKEIPWKEIVSGKAGHPKFDLTNAIQHTGTAFFTAANDPVPDGTQIMFYLQHDKWRYQTFTVNNGKIRVTLPDIYGPDEFFYLAETRQGKEITDLKIVWEDTPMILPRALESSEGKNVDRYGEYVFKKRLIDRSFDFYSEKTPVIPVDDDANFEDEVAEGDVTVNVEEYNILPTMEELIREVIPSLFHRKTSQKSIVRVSVPEPMNREINGDPVYIIDGIATKNTSFFLSLKPVDLVKVKIIKDPRKLLPLGLLGKNGIVIVETKKGNIREPRHDTSRSIEGLNLPGHFYAPDHSTTKDLHKPDFRSTIYWNPSIKTDATGKATIEFYCSDDPIKYKVRVEGLDKSGRPFTAVQELNVGSGPSTN